MSLSDLCVMVDPMHDTGAWYNPWTDLEQRHPTVHVEPARLGPVAGAWIPRQGVILINHTLDVIEARCALAHEIAHIDLGHSPRAPGWFGRRQERDADHLAAQRLIADDGLADLAAEQAVVVCEVAERFDVTHRFAAMRLTSLEHALLDVVQRT